MAPVSDHHSERVDSIRRLEVVDYKDVEGFANIAMCPLRLRA